MLDFLKNAKVMITGHTGFKGSWLTTILRNCCKDILGVSLPVSEENKLFSDLGLEKEIKSEYLDLTDFESIDLVLREFKPNYIFHLAAQSLVQRGFSDPITTFKTNVLGTQNLLEAIRTNKINSTIIIATTDKVYKNDESGIPFIEIDELGGADPYSASKASVEHLVYSYHQSFFKSESIRVGIARAGNVVGGGDWSEDRIVPDIIRSVYRGSKLNLRAPQSTRPWQHVLEPLFGYLNFASWLDKTNTPNFEIFNFGPEEKNVRCVSEVVAQMKLYFPELEVVLVTSKNKEAGKLLLNAEKAKKLLNVSSKLDFEKTMFHTAHWYGQYKAGYDPLKLCEDQVKNYLRNGL